MKSFAHYLPFAMRDVYGKPVWSLTLSPSLKELPFTRVTEASGPAGPLFQGLGYSQNWAGRFLLPWKGFVKVKFFLPSPILLRAGGGVYLGAGTLYFSLFSFDVDPLPGGPGGLSCASGLMGPLITLFSFIFLLPPFFVFSSLKWGILSGPLDARQHLQIRPGRALPSPLTNESPLSMVARPGI